MKTAADPGAGYRCRACHYLLTATRARHVACPHCGHVHPNLLKARKGAERRLPGGRLRILDARNPIARRGRVSFAFESFDHPAVRELRKAYDHARAMRDMPDEIHAQLALMNWLNRHLLSGGKTIEVYDRGRRHPAYRRGRFRRAYLDTDCQACSGFSYTFVPLASSVGHTARVVNVNSEDTYHGKHSFPHMIVEIWSNQYVKWVVLDALFNHSWWRGGVPLSALEVRESFLRCGGEDVTTRWGLSKAPAPRVLELGPTAGNPAKFQWILYLTANNFLAFPEEQKFWRGLLFRDKHNEGRPFTIYPDASRHPYAGEGLLDETTDPDDWNWPINLCELNVTCSRPGELDVHVYTFTPNFSRFVAKKGKGPWRKASRDFAWLLKSGRNRLTVQAVNTLGVRGPESFLELEWHPE